MEFKRSFYDFQTYCASSVMIRCQIKCVMLTALSDTRQWRGQLSSGPMAKITVAAGVTPGKPVAHEGGKVVN